MDAGKCELERLMNMLMYVNDIHTGKSELERASLLSLKLLETALQKQESYLSALRQTSGAGLGSRMDKLLLAINTRSGRPDHLVNVAKSVSPPRAILACTYNAHSGVVFNLS